MARRPICEESPDFQMLYSELRERLRARRPHGAFNLQDLFTEEEWLRIGDGEARQRFGRRFGGDVDREQFPGVERNHQRYELGGNEARYNFDVARNVGH